MSLFIKITTTVHMSYYFEIIAERKKSLLFLNSVYVVQFHKILNLFKYHYLVLDKFPSNYLFLFIW